MDRYLILILVFGLSLRAVFAQTAPTATIEKLDIAGFNAQFTEDGNQLLFTAQNFDGLKLYDLNTKKQEEITKNRGAGYEPQLQDRKVIYKLDANSEKLVSFDLDTRKTSVLPPSTKQQKAAFPSPIVNENIDNGLMEAAPSADLRTIELTFAGGATKVIAPLGDNDYLNVEISPNGNQLVFRVSGVGAYVTDLEGKIMRDLGNVEFPKWAGEGRVLCTETKDDGYNYTSSEVFLHNISEDVRWNLTLQTNAIALYPNINGDYSKIVFNTPKGELYLINLK